MSSGNNSSKPTIILLTNPRTYRAPHFAAAAECLGLNVVWGVDMPEEIAANRHSSLTIDFTDHDQAVHKIVKLGTKIQVKAVLALEDDASLIAAEANAALRLPHNDPSAALAARDKHIMRQALQDAGLNNPRFAAYALDEDEETLASLTQYPCVLKPTLLNGSRGVIRANNASEFKTAWMRVKGIVECAVGSEILVEDYIPGIEVAVEGLAHEDGLCLLAIFDKPDTPEGPFFEETIYVTPSRLPIEIQDSIQAVATQGAQALGLRFGPVHAELRINDQGVWLVEVAGRSIGGLCSKTLQFGHGSSLEELILRQAAGLPLTSLARQHSSSGVMMIPIPSHGLLRQVRGLEKAESEPGVDSVEISARINYPLRPLPDGDSYLGFIFATADKPAAVEAALRQACSKIQFEIEPEIRLVSGS